MSFKTTYCTDEAGRTSLDLGDWCLKTGEAAVPILEPGVIHGATHTFPLLRSFRERHFYYSCGLNLMMPYFCANNNVNTRMIIVPAIL